MIGEEIRRRVFRDTKSVYIEAAPSAPSYEVMKFVRANAGNEILDYGCATGMYCVELSKLGKTVKGVDVNDAYVRIAREKGVEAHLLSGTAPFPPKSFDTVMLLEVLEHLERPAEVLADALRLARKNVLVTTPNCDRVDQLQSQGLLFEHFADMDHKNFFTPDALRTLLSNYGSRVRVWGGNPISPLNLFRSKGILFAGKALTRLGILRAGYFMRLYAVVEV